MESYLDYYRSAVKFVMRERDISQKALAIDTGGTQGHISKLLSGQSEGTQRLREAIARAVGVSYPELLRIGEQLQRGDIVAELPHVYNEDFVLLFGEFPDLREYLGLAQRALSLGNRGMAVDIIKKIPDAVAGEDAGETSTPV